MIPRSRSDLPLARRSRVRELQRKIAELYGRINELEPQVAELEQRLDHERLYPLEWVNRRVRDRFGDTVRAGPFAGLEFPEWGVVQADLFSPKLLGTYELELHGALERLIAGAPPAVVNIGAADGYYAAGLALRLPAARVVAFESEAPRRELLASIAEHNGVAARVELRATCTREELAAAVEPGALVVSDCEGCEAELLDPAAVPALTEARMLVEVHDHIVGGASAALLERFATTHTAERIASRPRYTADHPDVAFLPYVTRELAVLEFRACPMQWLVFEPR